MSIQLSLSTFLLNKILRKLKVMNLYDYYLFLLQFLIREITSLIGLNKKNEKVFFPYYSTYTHPFILERNYGRKAPQYFFNLKSSSVVHCIQYPNPNKNYLGKKIIIEPNDHCLVIGGALGILEPSEAVAHCKIISDYISSPKVSRILLGDNELINHARFYFSEEALKKFTIYPEMACTPEITKYSLNEKKERLLAIGEIRYLSIASSYKIKAVDLLLEAFIAANVKANLTLVCHDIPENIEKKILKNKNINLIKKIPLTQKMKNQLYGNADVYVNTTYIDGGVPASRALDYGMPIITNEFHRGKSLVKNKNGILIKEPMKYYQPGRYGVEWNSFQGYLEKIYLLRKRGGFNDVIQQLINAFKYYEDEPLNVFRDGVKSLELAEENSLEKSNKALRDIYKSVAQEIT
jgi:hypothetical protein